MVLDQTVIASKCHLPLTRRSYVGVLRESDSEVELVTCSLFVTLAKILSPLLH